ncbi:MAG: hypothetical protein RDV48_01680 [Candidatus Eremiobacteraeota bacterium]|nr:hypothetical protein [Candidatus Eremiobacteraeota bacterium]
MDGIQRTPQGYSGSGVPQLYTGERPAQEPSYRGPSDGFDRGMALEGASMPYYGAETGEVAGKCPCDEPPPSPTLGWESSTGVHNGTNFSVMHPPGWKLITLPNTALLVSPDDKNTVVSFMWFTGLGTMDPGSLTNNTIAYNNLQNYEVLGQTPIQTVNTPGGSYRFMEQDGSYDYRGERCRHHLTSIVNDSGNPYLAFWSGSMIWSQAPEDKFDDSRQTLDLIANSIKIVPPEPAPLPPPGPPGIPPGPPAPEPPPGGGGVGIASRSPYGSGF